ncbi:hypothetical protein [Pseudoruegeria sp. SK021]|uniref:hypothetical protein n=1 Tax=Pseudoruegeria sp. SK021 TaxID=1933035 RepID=UPI00111C78A7|nr:hypothetical protein [Pseudoruegeria sp. SK021]
MLLHTLFRDSTHRPFLFRFIYQQLAGTYPQRNTIFNTYLTLQKGSPLEAQGIGREPPIHIGAQAAHVEEFVNLPQSKIKETGNGRSIDYP